MSPLWRDEIRIGLAPRVVSIRRMRRGLRPTLAAETIRELDGSDLEWQPALALLSACLDEAQSRGANARVVVSNLWARYAIVPWSDTLSNEDEHLAHARICLAQTYGAVGADWRVSLSESAPGEARVACALPEALLAGLRAALDAHRVRLVSVQPSLIAAYNKWRHRLPQGTGWFVSIEEGALAAARLVSGGWDRVYAARIGADWAMELLRLKTFARLASRGSSNGRVFVAAPARLRVLADTSDPQIEWLQPPPDASPSNVARLRPARLHT